MKKQIAIFLSCLFLFFSSGSYAQQPTPFADEIQDFKRIDSQLPPKRNSILFTGSSSIRMWKNLQASFPGYDVINRGFGGSTLANLDLYLNDIVFPYQPRQILIYSGENDIASDSANAELVLERFKTVFQKIRSKMPGVPIEYISIKPSPSRIQFAPVMREANHLIKAFLAEQQNTHFIDVFSLMLDDMGRPNNEIYLQDSLHMNSKGYYIWQQAIRPYLKK